MKNNMPFLLLTIWCIVSFVSSMIGLAFLTVSSVPNNIKAWIVLAIIFYDIILYKVYKDKCDRDCIEKGGC